jgi:hypothetical protein
VRELIAMPQEDVPKYRCYTGHFFSLLEPLVGRPLPTVTILRDPVEQTLSLLRHCQLYVPGAGLFAPFLARSLSFFWERFPPFRSRIEGSWCPVLMNNFQTRILAGAFPTPAQLGHNFYGLTYPFLERSFCSPELDMDNLYARAVQRLESMVVVGTVERLSETAGRICDLLDIAPPARLPKENVSAHRPRLSSAFLELIGRQNEYDRKLHALANKLLDTHG